MPPGPLSKLERGSGLANESYLANKMYLQIELSEQTLFG